MNDLNTASAKPTTNDRIEPLSVYSGGRKVKDFNSINEHHDGTYYKRKKVNINGKERHEKVRSDGRIDGGVKGIESGGVERLVKDIVLKDKSGHQSVPVRAAMTGTLQLTPSSKSGGYGNMAEILDDKGRVVARFAHLKDFNPNLKSGQIVTRGTSLGLQGTTGHSTGIHLHAEMPASEWTKYIEDTISGKFEQSKTNNSSNQASSPEKDDQITYKMIVPLVEDDAFAIQEKYGLKVKDSAVDMTTATLFCGKSLGLNLIDLIEQSCLEQNLSDSDALSHKFDVMSTYNKVESAINKSSEQSVATTINNNQQDMGL
jgi:Peptidase family M23